MPELGFSLEVEGLTEAIKQAEAMGANVKPLNNAAITNSLNKVQSETRRRAAHRTGTLQRSILTQVNYPNGQAMVEAKYGQMLETGTGIYGPNAKPIEPKTAAALAWKSGGRMMFAKQIKGMRAQPFWKPGIDSAMGYIEGQFNTVLDKIIIGLGGR